MSVPCVSVHGANRLGGNSLIELLVFGKFGGMAVKESVRNSDYGEISEGEARSGEEFIESLFRERARRSSPG
ncbi:MAG: hypothetical protein Q9N34_02340 [Aquificota bacterium]|nr:hypothetical protein [Aquificota bacterium]